MLKGASPGPKSIMEAERQRNENPRFPTEHLRLCRSRHSEKPPLGLARSDGSPEHGSREKIPKAAPSRDREVARKPLTDGNWATLSRSEKPRGAAARANMPPLSSALPRLAFAPQRAPRHAYR
jgi:hypothetical protein